jgi:hypothetical protein
MKRILLVAALLATASAAFAQARVPVVIEGSEYDPCGNGVVYGLDPNGDGWLAVKAGPDIASARIDKLYNGQRVYTCAWRGEWIGIVYPPPSDAEETCNVTTSWPVTQPYTGPCRSGWVHRNWIKLIAG